MHTFKSVTGEVCATTTNNGCPKLNTFLLTPSLPTGLQNLSQKAFTQIEAKTKTKTRTKTKTKTKDKDKDKFKRQKSKVINMHA